jgi:hypothetical protein
LDKIANEVDLDEETVINMIWDIGDVVDTWDDAQKKMNEHLKARALELGISKQKSSDMGLQAF